jgi:hypothetical protein
MILSVKQKDTPGRVLVCEENQADSPSNRTLATACQSLRRICPVRYRADLCVSRNRVFLNPVLRWWRYFRKGERSL